MDNIYENNLYHERYQYYKNRFNALGQKNLSKNVSPKKKEILKEIDINSFNNNNNSNNIIKKKIIEEHENLKRDNKEKVKKLELIKCELENCLIDKKKIESEFYEVKSHKDNLKQQIKDLENFYIKENKIIEKKIKLFDIKNEYLLKKIDLEKLEIDKYNDLLQSKVVN